MLNKGTKMFLTELHRIGAVKIDTEKGFRLTLHDKNPSAPLSPIYVNLRTEDNPKPGPLLEPHILTIASDMNTALEKARWKFDCIAGIPRAGTPFAEGVATIRERLGHPTKLIRLKKRSKDSRALRVDAAYVIRDRDNVRPRVVLVDDLITKAVTKWTAIEAVRRAGYEVAGIIVYLDREQGGLRALERSGVPITSVVKFSQVLTHYKESGAIDAHDMRMIQSYLSANS